MLRLTAIVFVGAFIGWWYATILENVAKRYQHPIASSFIRG